MPEMDTHNNGDDDDDDDGDDNGDDDGDGDGDLIDHGKAISSFHVKNI